MEYALPTLLERDDIKQEVAKWIQHTTDQINNYKSELAKSNKSEPVGEELAKICLEQLKKEGSRLAKLEIIFILALGMKNIAKFVMPKRRALILVASMLKDLVFLNWIARLETVCWPSITMILTWKIVILGSSNNWLKASVCHVIVSISDYIINCKTWFNEINKVHGYDCNKAKTLMLRLLYLGSYYEAKKN